MLTFEELAKRDTPHTRFGDNTTTEFWEELYQLFKTRMIKEQSNKHTDDQHKAGWEALGRQVRALDRDLSSQNTVSTPMNGTWKYSPTLEKEVFVPDEPTKPSEDK